MKKFLKIILSAAMLAVALFAAGCKANDLPANDGKIKIVATIFPEYDWVRQIAGDSDDLDITFLMKNGGDLHSYSPGARDIVKISTADILVYVGGESDKWIDDILKNSSNPNMKIINLMEILGENIKEEEYVEGMEEEHEHGHDTEEIEYDEHVWLSVKNAGVFVNAIADAMIEKDGKNADKYIENRDDYLSQLNDLDRDYQGIIEKAKFNTLIFADRFPFRYLTDDYGLNYYAAFKGCSAETEASFETVTFLANKADELNLPRILIIDGSDGKIAKTVAASSQNKNRPVYSLDSLQSVTDGEIQSGKTYIKAMESNLEILKQTLN